MDGLQASILSAKLPHILEWTDKRRMNARLYDEYLKSIPEVQTPKVRPGSKHSYHLYVIKAEKRDQLKNYLQEKKIETTIHYPTALPNLPAYQYLRHSSDAFPVATRLQNEILSLPMFPELTEEMIVYIAEAIRSFYRN